MFKTDYNAFAEMLDGVYALHGKTLPAPAKAIFFRTLAKYPLEMVRAALDAHVADSQRGQYAPKPADLLAQIEGSNVNDGRPGADEAWAIAVRSMDENETVVTNPEIMEALGIARPVMSLGDEVGARVAFKDAYTRIVTQARLDQRAVMWIPSLGWDKTRHEAPLRDAVSAGRLPAPEARRHVPALSAPDFHPEGLSKVLALVATMRPASEIARERREARAAAERQRLIDAKLVTDEAVKAHADWPNNDG